jgi:DHA1 family inner membrane transport protein
MSETRGIAAGGARRWRNAAALLLRAASATSTRTESGTLELVRRYWPLYGLVFLIGTENFIISPFLPTMAQDLASPVQALAYAVTAYSLAYALSAPVLGSVSDRLGSRRLIAAGVAVFVLGNFCVAVSPSVSMLHWARALTGAGGAMAGPAIWAYIAGDATADLRGRAMGVGMGAFSMGQVIGIPVGGLVASFSDWRWAIGGIGCLMAPLGLAAWLGQRRTNAPRPLTHAGLPLLAVWKSKPVTLAFLVNLLFQAANLACYTYLGSLLAERFRLSTGQIGTIGILVGAGSLMGALVGGKVNDVWRLRGGKGAHLEVLWALLLAGSILVATGAVPLVASLAAIVLWFFASGAFVTTQMALITAFVPTMRATAVSWNNSLMHAGAGMGVWTIGLGLARHIAVGWIGLGFGLAAAAGAVALVPVEAAVLAEKTS